jgi:hypothetical protein
MSLAQTRGRDPEVAQSSLGSTPPKVTLHTQARPPTPMTLRYGRAGRIWTASGPLTGAGGGRGRRWARRTKAPPHAVRKSMHVARRDRNLPLLGGGATGGRRGRVLLDDRWLPGRAVVRPGRRGGAATQKYYLTKARTPQGVTGRAGRELALTNGLACGRAGNRDRPRRTNHGALGGP